MNMRTLGWERFRKGLIFFLALAFIGSLLSNFLSGKDDRLPKDLALPSMTLTAVWPPDELDTNVAVTAHTTDWQEKPILVTFGATWCWYCREEMSMLERLHQEFGPKGIRVVSVSAEDRYQALRTLAQAKGVTFPIYASAGALFKHYTVDPIPFHVFIDKNGFVAGDVTGKMREEDARSRLQALLDE